MVVFFTFLKKGDANKTAEQKSSVQDAIKTYSSGQSSQNSLPTAETNQTYPSFYSADFNAQYVSSEKKYLITKKTATYETDEKIRLWLDQNNIKQENIKIIEDLPQGSSLGGSQASINSSANNSPVKEIAMLNNFLNIFLQLGQTKIPSVAISPTPPPISKDQPNDGNVLVYYPQCSGSYDDYPLPNGCNICQSGCGPTTVAMILSTYINVSYDPTAVVEQYKTKGFYAGCDGSSYSDAKAFLNQMGLSTTDYLIYDDATIGEVADDFKNYLKNGWTIFTLGRYCDGGCGHYFWITEIDQNNNVWAYDPYYGRMQSPPINENKYYPFPKYRLAFGVKKI